jgi:hypothetical protein
VTYTVLSAAARACKELGPEGTAKTDNAVIDTAKARVGNIGASVRLKTAATRWYGREREETRCLSAFQNISVGSQTSPIQNAGPLQ